MNGKDGTTAFLPPDSKIGGEINHNRPSVGQFKLENRLCIQESRNR